MSRVNNMILKVKTIHAFIKVFTFYLVKIYVIMIIKGKEMFFLSNVITVATSWNLKIITCFFFQNAPHFSFF